jgi:hypothetical protein
MAPGKTAGGPPWTTHVSTAPRACSDPDSPAARVLASSQSVSPNSSPGRQRPAARSAAGHANAARRGNAKPEQTARRAATVSPVATDLVAAVLRAPHARRTNRVVRRIAILSSTAAPVRPAGAAPVVPAGRAAAVSRVAMATAEGVAIERHRAPMTRSVASAPASMAPASRWQAVAAPATSIVAFATSTASVQAPASTAPARLERGESDSD